MRLNRFFMKLRIKAVSVLSLMIVLVLLPGYVAAEENIATGKTVFSSSSFGGYVASNAVDGVIATSWISEASPPMPQNITIDLESTYSITNITFYQGDYGSVLHYYQFEISSDNNSYSILKSNSSADALTWGSMGGTWNGTASNVRWVRIQGNICITGDPSCGISEINITGTNLIYLNDSFDRSDSSDIGTNWSGSINQYNISNNNLTRITGESPILVNSTLMPLNATGYVVKVSNGSIHMYMQNTTNIYGYGYRIRFGYPYAYLDKRDGATSVNQIDAIDITSVLSSPIYTNYSVVSVPNKAGFNIFIGGKYAGYLEDTANTYTSGYCGTDALDQPLDYFLCYNPGTVFYESPYISSGEYNLSNGQYSDLIVLKSGTLNISNVNISSDSNNNASIIIYGGTLKIENSTQWAKNTSTWTQMLVSNSMNSGSDLRGLPNFQINNSRFENYGNNTEQLYHNRSGFVFSYYDNGSYINNSIINNSGQIWLNEGSLNTVEIINNKFQNPRLHEGAFIYIFQSSNISIINNSFIANYSTTAIDGTEDGIYIQSGNNINYSNNYMEGVWNYAFDVVSTQSDYIMIGNTFKNSNKGVVFNGNMTNIYASGNKFINIQNLSQGFNEGYAQHTINGTFINSTIDSIGNYTNSGMKEAGNNINITGFKFFNLTSGGATGNAGQSSSAFFKIWDASDVVVNDLEYFSPVTTNNNDAGFLVDYNTLHDAGTKNLTATNITIPIGLKYGIQLYPCENCTFRDINVSGTTNDIYIQNQSHMISFINSKNNNVGFETGNGTVNIFYYADINITDMSENPISGAMITFNQTAITRNGSNISSVITGADGHTPLPIGNDSTLIFKHKTKNSTSETNYSYQACAEKENYATKCVTIEPDESWYRPDPNTYQNTTQITLEEAAEAEQIQIMII